MILMDDCFLQILDIESGDTYFYYESDYYQEMFDKEFEQTSKIIESMELPYVPKSQIRRDK
jgi:hypothetical protein